MCYSCHGPGAQRGGAVSLSCVTPLRPSCRVASCKGHPVLGRAERSSPTCPRPAQLCHVLSNNRICSALPSCEPAASQFLWSPEGAAGLGAGSLLACGVAAQPGIGGQVVWAGGLLAGRFLDTKFFLRRTLELSAVHLGISTLQLGQGPVTQSTSSGVGQEGCSRNGLRG